MPRMLNLAGPRGGRFYRPPEGGGGGGGADLGLENAALGESVTPGPGSIEDLAFTPDGTRMFLTSGATVYAYDLSTAWDLRTATLGASRTFGVSVLRGLAFNDDGTSLFIADQGEDIREWDLATPYDITSKASSAAVSFTSLRASASNLNGLAFNADGTRLFTADITSEDIRAVDLSGAYDLSTATVGAVESVAVNTPAPAGLAFSPSGTIMFVASLSSKALSEYALSTPFDPSSKAFVRSHDLTPLNLSPRGVGWAPDGSKLFFAETQNESVYELDLTGGTGLSCAANAVAVASASGWGSADFTEQLGWRFTVGASALNVCAIRLYAAVPQSAVVRIWRVSDEALVGEVEFTPDTLDAWNTVDITPVTLGAGADYVVTSRLASGISRPVYRNPTRTLDGALTFVEGRFVDGDGFPSATSANEYLAPDIVFTA